MYKQVQSAIEASYSFTCLDVESMGNLLSRLATIKLSISLSRFALSKAAKKVKNTHISSDKGKYRKFLGNIGKFLNCTNI